MRNVVCKPPSVCVKCLLPPVANLTEVRFLSVIEFDVGWLVMVAYGHSTFFHLENGILRYNDCRWRPNDNNMVYHYTNFIVETNGWWLRRVRPVSNNLNFRSGWLGDSSVPTSSSIDTTSSESTQLKLSEQHRQKFGNNVAKITNDDGDTRVSIVQHWRGAERNKFLRLWAVILYWNSEDYDYGIEYSNRLMMITDKTVDQIL